MQKVKRYINKVLTIVSYQSLRREKNVCFFFFVAIFNKLTTYTTWQSYFTQNSQQIFESTDFSYPSLETQKMLIRGKIKLSKLTCRVPQALQFLVDTSN